MSDMCETDDIFDNRSYHPSKERNIVSDWLETGLREWENYASVAFLENQYVRLPYISAPALAVPKGTFAHHLLLVSGMHLEETSGPNVTLNPHYFHHWRRQGISFTIFPVINQHGLRFPEGSPDHLLRYDGHNVNYNDCWGKSPRSTQESLLISQKIRQLHSQDPVDLVVSLHEDSVTPKKGYAYFLGLSDSFLDVHSRKVRSTASSSFLASFIPEDGPDQVVTLDECPLEEIRDGWQIVNAQDDTAFENWVYDELGIPSILIEGPFGLPLPDRTSFQLDLLSASIGSLIS